MKSLSFLTGFKPAFVALGLLTASSIASAQDTYCKHNDYNDCTKVLKAKNKDTDFSNVYDQVCSDNKGFKCIKITIRGEPNEELAYQKGQYPKAQLFLTKTGGEDKIYVLEKREGYKPPVPKKIVEKKSAKKETTQTKKNVSEDEIVDPEGPHVPLEGE